MLHESEIYYLSALFFPLSRHGEKYVRKSRLDWPDGAASRDSIKAVLKLPRLQVGHCFCIKACIACVVV